MPRLRLLEDFAHKSEHRVRENQETILEPTKPITEQRQSLSESASEEIQAIKFQIGKKAETRLPNRNKKRVSIWRFYSRQE